MLKQRLQNRSLLQYLLPAAFLLAVVGMTITTAHSTRGGAREAVFDLLTRLNARPAEQNPVSAIIDIDAESLREVGPWPWPRTAIAGLVTAARDAGAAAVVVTVPVDGEDPLSPDIAAKYWKQTDRLGELSAVLAQLPTNNAALAAAANGGPVAIGVGDGQRPIGPWTRSDVLAVDWATLGSETATGFIALRAPPAHGDVDPAFDETAMVAVATLRPDDDGIFRRTPLLWARPDQPAPSAALASVLLSQGQITLTRSVRTLRADGAPVTSLTLPGGRQIPLDQQSGIRLWLPKDVSVPTVSAWRVLNGGDAWTQPLAGQIVFIGQSVAANAMVATARGEQPTAMVHAQLTEQLLGGHIAKRPQWSGWVEALGALIFGALSLLVALALRPTTAALFSTLIAASAVAVTLMAFQHGALLIDPLPVLLAAIGTPILALLVHVGGMLRGGDVARATFHGALPAATVAKLQSQGPGRLLDGARREVTVMSCGLNVSDQLGEAYKDRPADFIALVGAFTDVLRNTILESGGTIDYAEDGRLLGYWNAPEPVADPIEQACGCALKLIEQMNRLWENVQTSSFAASEITDFSNTKLEVGIATGECFAGALGHGTRKRYSVIGDPVTRAGLLRSRASLYGPAIITDDVVFDTLRHQYAFLDLDALVTRDGEPERTVYGLSGNSFLKASKAFRTLADTQRELVLSWKNGDIAAATVKLQRLRGVPGVPDSYIDLFDNRIRAAHASARL